MNPRNALMKNVFLLSFHAVKIVDKSGGVSYKLTHSSFQHPFYIKEGAGGALELYEDKFLLVRSTHICENVLQKAIHRKEAG